MNAALRGRSGLSTLLVISIVGDKSSCCGGGTSVVGNVNILSDCDDEGDGGLCAKQVIHVICCKLNKNHKRVHSYNYIIERMNER